MCIFFFLNLGRSNSFSSFCLKNSDKNLMRKEISWDNPLEMDSNAESKKLELADLAVKHSIQELTDIDYDEGKINWIENNGIESRNKLKYLSRENSSIWNFKSMDITNNSCASSIIEDIEREEKRSENRFWNSPIKKYWF